MDNISFIVTLCYEGKWHFLVNTSESSIPVSQSTWNTVRVDAAVDILNSVLQIAMLKKSSEFQPVVNFSSCLHNLGTLDEHMHLLLPALIRLFKVDASVDIRRAAIKTLTRLIPCVQVSSWLVKFPVSCIITDH